MNLPYEIIIEILKFIYKPSEICSSLVREEQMSLFDIAMQYNLSNNDRAGVELLKKKEIERFKYYVGKKKAQVSEKTLHLVIYIKDVNLLSWFIEFLNKNNLMSGESMDPICCTFAGTNFEIMKILKFNNVPWDKYTYSSVLRNGIYEKLCQCGWDHTNDVII